MSVTIQDLLDRFREMSKVPRDHGTWFEELMVTYLRTDPLYADRFSDVWMWNDWPGRDGGDTGIDIVARERETGEYCAIQCKFYEPTHTLQKADIDSFFTASGKVPFTSRMIISTTEKWGSNAEKALENQQIPVSRVGMADLLDSAVDWDIAWPTTPTTIELPVASQKKIRHHQRRAIDKVFAGFAEHDRGQMIMACGTGKTFTALKLAEELTLNNEADDTFVLFLVPSISLLSQTLREWTYQSELPLRSFAVCSDTRVSKSGEDISAHDLALPATTNPVKLVEQVTATTEFTVEGLPGAATGKRLTVIYSTYQSIEVIHAAQQAGLPEFDLIVCDEAHRTTGVTLANQDESHFVKVHDNDFLAAKRRLYMTATPKLFRDDVKQAAREKDAELCSMDDPEVFGPEFHRLGFGEAVEKGLLTDYKVLILTVDEKYLAKSLQSQVADENNELTLDDAIKIVGCWNGLAKRSGEFADGSGFGPDEIPMKRAVAFNRSIADSKKIADKFSEVLDDYNDAHNGTLHTEVEHVDGTYNSLRRNALLEWLKEDTPDNTCRILTNAKCLSEGIDVPALDAVLFLNPRNSQVDVVQSVGRVMRKTDDKDYGYIILPVGVPADMDPAEALSDNKRYKVIWQVLQALRAHDDRFDATVNKINLNVNKPNQIMVGVVGGGTEGYATSTDPKFNSGSAPGWAGAGTPGTPVHQGGQGEPSGTTANPVAALTTGAKSATAVTTQLAAFPVDEWRDAIYAKIVQKVGERAYWEDWASEIAEIAQRHVDRIKLLVEDPLSGKSEAFAAFLEELRNNINPGVTEDDAIDMLAQHIITKPVFDALFSGFEFSQSNPVSVSMQAMLDVLEDQALNKEAAKLESFYESVRKRAEGIDNFAGRQKVITELYERFFKAALPKTAEQLGIVYTPIEVVDFILRATNQALERHFGTDLSAEGVQVLDPFAGTGTFIVRMLQTGLIRPEDLLRKYVSELHANEIVLLAYYIAAINIEAAFHQAWSDQGGEDTYLPFDGIVLTDTFQLAENPASLDAELFPENNKRLQRQKALDIRVIVGNPPYSAGQTSANDNNQNQTYQALDKRIAETYAARSTATNKNSLYDSYIRAIRWASDRIKTEGVIAYVSNGGYIDSNTADGLRLSLAEEFSDIYCFNLRGNQRTAGDLSEREGGKVFGSGSRATVAILLLVKTTDSVGSSRIHYRDIGDYLNREQKLNIVAESDLNTIEWVSIAANSSGDWINQRNDEFETYSPIGDKTAPGSAFFTSHCPGLQTNRDAWVYGFSKSQVSSNASRMIRFYEEQRLALGRFCEQEGKSNRAEVAKNSLDNDPTKISWSSSIVTRLVRDEAIQFDSGALRTAVYRPFTKEAVYFDPKVLHRPAQLPSLFPTSRESNIGFYVTTIGAAMEFTALAVNEIPDQAMFGGQTNGQFFARWRFVEVDGGIGAQGDLLDSSADVRVRDGLRREDNITDAILVDYKSAYGDGVTKDDVFYYVYGMLHSPEYRQQFRADLKKMLPRIPKVQAFAEFAAAGRALADLHIGYEEVEPYPLMEELSTATGLSEDEVYRVQKMAFGKGAGKAKDKSRIVYNSHLTLSGIPAEAYRYMLGSRSGLEWIIDRYQVKVDKDSGIKNDPNDWSAEVGNPRYIVDLLKRVVTVSIETMRIVDGLPPLDVVEG